MNDCVTTDEELDDLAYKCECCIDDFYGPPEIKTLADFFESIVDCY